MRILHYTGCWPTNIGNAFIDLGAKALYKKAFPDCEVLFTSSYAQYVSEYVEHKSYFSLLHQLDIDYFSIAGCCLGSDTLKNSLHLFEELRKINPKIKFVIVGAGMWNYSVDTSISREIIAKINPIIFTSRDDLSFEVGKAIRKVYSGIDCGFYVSDYFLPPILRNKHVCVVDAPNFMLEAEPTEVIYSYHNISHKYVEKRQNFTSDLPEDYLTLYANARHVYSNRIHAAVVSFAYQIPVTFINSCSFGKRVALFDKVGEYDYTKVLIPDRSKLEVAKLRQIEFLRNNWE